MTKNEKITFMFYLIRPVTTNLTNKFMRHRARESNDVFPQAFVVLEVILKPKGIALWWQI